MSGAREGRKERTMEYNWIAEHLRLADLWRDLGRQAAQANPEASLDDNYMGEFYKISDGTNDPRLIYDAERHFGQGYYGALQQ